MKVPITRLGAEKLRGELHKLKSEDRPRIIKAIAEARAHGDLKENAEYHAAKEEQSFVEGRINEIESKLSHAQVIDVTSMPQTGKVIFGATVSLFHLDKEEEVTYQIVGEDEAAIKEGKIAFNSPIGKALIGKEEGDTVVVDAPSGEQQYEVTDVRYE